MVIKSFVFTLFLLAIISYFIPVDNKNKKDQNEDLPLLNFYDSTMYTLTPTEMTRVIYAKKATRYKTKDTMTQSALTMKAKDNNNNDVTDVIYSDVTIKIGDVFRFYNNVKYRRDNLIKLNTEEMVYDSKNEIATNNVPFDGYYFNDYIKGTHLYLDLQKSKMKSKKSHFEIDMNNK